MNQKKREKVEKNLKSGQTRTGKFLLLGILIDLFSQKITVHYILMQAVVFILTVFVELKSKMVKLN